MAVALPLPQMHFIWGRQEGAGWRGAAERLAPHSKVRIATFNSPCLSGIRTFAGWFKYNRCCQSLCYKVVFNHLSLAIESQVPVELLSTKLSIPPLRSRLVARPGLIQKLNQASDRGFFLFSAPAGYGKTTLLSTWLRSLDVPAAWYSIDEADNDPVRFLAYLSAALGKIDPILEELIGSRIQTPPLPPVEAVLTPLINRLAQVSQPFWLALDDYHLVQNPFIHETVQFLVTHRPQPLHLALVTRADPPLPLSRLRACSEMVEVRLDDLQFSQLEATEFFNRTMGLRISRTDAARITARTEGWITGLQIAALALQNAEDIPSLIGSFTGGQRHIFDYLLEEVLQRQPEGLQTFLLKSSILKELNGPLCDAVTGQTGSQAILELLERANLFVVALDEQHCWYRYHHLFSDLLRQRLEHTQPGLALALHLQASQWYEKNSKMTEAIGQAFEAQDFARAARLIDKTADATFLNGEIRTFLGWMELIPQVIASQHPILCVYHAEALLLSGKPMGEVAKLLEGTPEYDAIQALIASYQGDVHLSKSLSARALAHLPVGSVFLKGAITSALGAILLLGGEVEPAIQAFRVAAEIGRENGNRMLEVIALSRQAQIHMVQGDLQQAEEQTRKALEISKSRQGDYLPLSGMPLMVLAYLLYERAELKQALSYIEKAIELSQLSGGFWSVDCYIVHAFILQSIGNGTGAREAYANARTIASQTRANRFDEIYTGAYEVRLFAAQGNTRAARQWVKRNMLDEPGPVSGVAEARYQPQLFHLVELEQISLARVTLAQGGAEKALEILTALFPESERRGRTRSLVENMVLQAVAYQAQRRLEAACGALEKALALAEPGGFVQIFVDEGQPMKKLLLAAAARGIQPQYTAGLLGAYENSWAASLTRSVLEGTPEKLSARELNVLKLVAQGSSDKKIAETLFISPETVHKHLNNIFGKLGVHNRTEAAARAQQLGLL